MLGSKFYSRNSPHSSGSPMSASSHPPIFFTLPWGVTFDSKGRRIIVSQLNQHLVQVFDYYGDYIFKIGGPGSKPGQFDHPRGVCVQAGTDNIVVTSDGRVQ